MEIDDRELQKLAIGLGKVAEDYQKESRKFLKEEAKKLRKETIGMMSSKVGKKTGNLRKGIKSGKVYSYKSKDNLSVRVYGGKPAYHAHLIDRGHDIVTPYRWKNKARKHGGGAKKGRARAFPFFQPATEGFQREFEKDCEDYLDSLILGRLGK